LPREDYHLGLGRTIPNILEDFGLKRANNRGLNNFLIERLIGRTHREAPVRIYISPPTVLMMGNPHIFKRGQEIGDTLLLPLEKSTPP
jgi:hypothetical protein